jgi:hypothetical protein
MTIFDSATSAKISATDNIITFFITLAKLKKTIQKQALNR